MAEQSDKSRRAVLAGGAAAAVGVPMAIAAITHEALAPQWSPAAPEAERAPTEVARWQDRLGHPFRIEGEYGGALAHLAAVVTGAPDPDRPAELARAVPFTLYFDVDPRLAPAGQKTYSVTGADRQAFDVFLSRGSDRRDKAVAYAIFN